MLFVELVLIFILLLIGAFTAASETAIVAASIVKLRHLAQDGSKTARIVLKILETPERFFGTILVANNIVDAFIASLVTALVISLMGKEEGVIIATIIASFLIIVFEVTAKTLASNSPVRLSIYFARSIQLLILVLSPFVELLSVITKFFVRLFGGTTKGKTALVIEDEIRALIKIGEGEGASRKERYKLLSKAFEFSETIIKDIMMPKDKIFSVGISEKLETILEKALEAGYSRIPVYKDSPEEIIGIINVKDLLNLTIHQGLIILQDIIYPPIFVQELRKVMHLLREFQKGHTHLAIVLDTENKLVGLITLEDLLEEIVGEIEDEYDIRYPREEG